MTEFFEMLYETILEFDHSVLIFIQENLRAAFLTPAMEAVSYSVNAGILWILLSAVFICFKRTRVMGIAMLTSVAFCFLINNVIIKNVVARTRPFDLYDDIIVLINKPTDYSFASGHTTASFAAVGILCRFVEKPWAVLAALYALLVAYSRLYLGVHYPTDVLCGMLIGVLGSMFVYWLYSKRFNLEEHKLNT